jgi:hypothetical protein
MNLKLRFLLAGASTTIGCLIWYAHSPYLPRCLGSALVLIFPYLLTLPRVELTGPLQSWLPRNPRVFFFSMSILAGLFLVFVLASRIPDDWVDDWSWLWVGPLWLLQMWVFRMQYARRKREQEASRRDSDAPQSVADAPSLK